MPPTRRKLSAQPVAGRATSAGAACAWRARMAEYARHLVHAGAKVVGGCCGTTPSTSVRCEFVRPLSRASRSPGGVSLRAASLVRDVTHRAVEVQAVPLAQRHAGGEVARTFVTSSRSFRREGWMRRGCSPMRKLKVAGVDAERPRRAAQSWMGALLTSLLIEQQVGIETVTHYARRDRNLLGMLSDLLGASAIGPQLAAHHRGSAEDGAVSERDGGVRHRR